MEGVREGGGSERGSKSGGGREEEGERSGEDILWKEPQTINLTSLYRRRCCSTSM